MSATMPGDYDESEPTAGEYVTCPRCGKRVLPGAHTCNPTLTDDTLMQIYAAGALQHLQDSTPETVLSWEKRRARILTAMRESLAR